MTEPADQEPALDWATHFASEAIADAFETERHGVHGLWSPLAAAATAAAEPVVATALEALSKIASLYVRPDDWHLPYGPAITLEDRRTAIPSDLTDDEIAALRSSVASIPHRLLRARTADVLSILSAGEARIELARVHLDALIDNGISDESWSQEREMWDRGLLVARRFGAPMRTRLAKLEMELRRIVRTSNEPFVAVRAADVLAEHGLARDRSKVIAERMEKLAARFAGDPERARDHLRSAAEWFARAGLSERSNRAAGAEIQSLVDDAEAQGRDCGSQGTMRASHLYELALQRVRALPRAVRQELGYAGLPAQIARRIRELGAASLGSMVAFTSDPIDLSDAAKRARDQVKGREPLDALYAFSALADFAKYEAEKGSAEALIQEHPLQSLFGNVHFSRDGRVVYRSSGQGGTPIYGVDPATWRQMIQAYELRVRFLSQGAIWPAFVQLTNEHHLGVGDFAVMVRDTPIVPSDRTLQFARALSYGFNGDFSTAAQLLTPQLENLVRQHLANAGEATSTINGDQIEAEVGMSALMERASVTEVFGPDISFELRALLCGPIGPNLRNDVAHGLLSDGEAEGANGLYLWWFALRLIVIPFWNALHDREAAEGREPARPREPEEEEE